MKENAGVYTNNIIERYRESQKKRKGKSKTVFPKDPLAVSFKKALNFEFTRYNPIRLYKCSMWLRVKNKTEYSSVVYEKKKDFPEVFPDSRESILMSF